MLVDRHCHLDFPEFAPDLEAVVVTAENDVLVSSGLRDRLIVRRPPTR